MNDSAVVRYADASVSFLLAALGGNIGATVGAEGGMIIDIQLPLLKSLDAARGEVR